MMIPHLNMLCLCMIEMIVDEVDCVVVKNVLHNIKMSLKLYLVIFERLKPTTLYTKYNVYTSRLGYFTLFIICLKTHNLECGL
mgnify:CR=1 FL=1